MGPPLLDKNIIPVISRILQGPARAVVHDTRVPRCTVNTDIASGRRAWALGSPIGHGNVWRCSQAIDLGSECSGDRRVAPVWKPESCCVCSSGSGARGRWSQTGNGGIIGPAQGRIRSRHHHPGAVASERERTKRETRCSMCTRKGRGRGGRVDTCVDDSDREVEWGSGVGAVGWLASMWEVHIWTGPFDYPMR